MYALFIVVHIFSPSVSRWWGFLLASACSCWSPHRSFSWPLPSCCAASASAAKATTTRCRPKDAVRAGAQSRSEDGASLFFFFLSFFFSFLFNPFLRSLPPTSFERFIFFGLCLHQPRLLRDPSLCMREAWEKRQSLHLGLMRGAGGVSKGPRRSD